MFTKGQLIFAVLFAITFIGVLIYSYRKDVKLHRFHFKGSGKVVIGFLLFIALLFVIKYFLKK
nr:hypothetical protein [Flavobacterium sp. UBA6135]